MLQARKNVLMALLTFGAVFASMQPWKAYAFQSASSADLQGQIYAVKSGEALPLIAPLRTKQTVISFEYHYLLIDTLWKGPETQADKAIYATAHEVSGETLTSRPQSQLQIEAGPSPASMPVLEAVSLEPSIEEHHVDNTAYALNAERLFDMVNLHRSSIGLPPLQKDERLMQVTQGRGPEIFDEIFVNGNMHAGFYGRGLPYRATENLIYNNSEEGALTWWLNSSVHRQAIEGNYQFAGIGCDGKACSMIFSNFEQK